MAVHSRIRPLVATGARLSTRARSRLPGLWFVTDPTRTPDPVSIAAMLPRGSAVIYRAFGAANAIEIGRALRRVTRRNGLTLLVGADATLARKIQADGVHLPERLSHRAGAVRRAHPNWRVTAAAHDGRAIMKARRAGAQAVLVSPVFASRSPSASHPLGRVRFELLARQAGMPIIALGGINQRMARRLTGSAAAGIAAVDGLSR